MEHMQKQTRKKPHKSLFLKARFMAFLVNQIIYLPTAESLLVRRLYDHRMSEYVSTYALRIVIMRRQLKYKLSRSSEHEDCKR